MSLLAPHLLLRADPVPSGIATQLRTSGYVVSKITDDDSAELLASASHVDGVVIDLPTHAAISIARRLQARFGSEVMIVVVASGAEVVRKALATVVVVERSAAVAELTSAVDLALASHLVAARARAVAS
jgi:DNA-binding response OmpR family regulator